MTLDEYRQDYKNSLRELLDHRKTWEFLHPKEKFIETVYGGRDGAEVRFLVLRVLPGNKTEVCSVFKTLPPFPSDLW